ncbi:hypothetical protein FQA39_LY02699 [Lamprigera yunnana]|nr:hypothetical protein FQA39_LY02699 [Lamprigera yunnana]
MVVQSLPQDVRSLLRSGLNINSLSQCVMELVYNGLDAKATSIAVRINLLTFRIQVVDNGVGISKSNMDLIGVRYMTSKCHSLEDLKKTKYFGFRGEALSSICQMSKKVDIASRAKDTDSTLCKIYENGTWSSVVDIKMRPSEGTTITITEFLYNFPVRQKRICKNLDLNETKQKLEELAIIHPTVSFSLRNDGTGKIILQSTQTKDVARSLISFYPYLTFDDFSKIKVSKGKTRVTGLIYKRSSKNSKLQFIYLNKRPIVSWNIQKLTNSLLLKITAKGEHPVYCLNIQCGSSKVDLTLSPSKTSVAFMEWEVVHNCIQKAVKTVLESDNVVVRSQSLHNRKVPSFTSQFGMSQLKGVVKGKRVKRKIINEDENNSQQNKGTKIMSIEDNTNQIFDKNTNPQSLLCNKKDGSKKETMPNDTVNSNIILSQEKGKELIMDMFLKSSEAYAQKQSQTQTDNVKTVVLEQQTKKTFANTTMMTMTIVSKKTILKNSKRVTNNEKVASKCVQTTTINQQNRTIDFNAQLENTVSKYFFKAEKSKYDHFNSKFIAHFGHFGKNSIPNFGRSEFFIRPIQKFTFPGFAITETSRQPNFHTMFLSPYTEMILPLWKPRAILNMPARRTSVNPNHFNKIYSPYFPECRKRLYKPKIETEQMQNIFQPPFVNSHRIFKKNENEKAMVPWYRDTIHLHPNKFYSENRQEFQTDLFNRQENKTKRQKIDELFIRHHQNRHPKIHNLPFEAAPKQSKFCINISKEMPPTGYTNNNKLFKDCSENTYSFFNTAVPDLHHSSSKFFTNTSKKQVLPSDFFGVSSKNCLSYFGTNPPQPFKGILKNREKLPATYLNNGESFTPFWKNKHQALESGNQLSTAPPNRTNPISNEDLGNLKPKIFKSILKNASEKLPPSNLGENQSEPCTKMPYFQSRNNKVYVNSNYFSQSSNKSPIFGNQQINCRMKHKNYRNHKTMINKQLLKPAQNVERNKNIQTSAVRSNFFFPNKETFIKNPINETAHRQQVENSYSLFESKDDSESKKANFHFPSNANSLVFLTETLQNPTHFVQNKSTSNLFPTCHEEPKDNLNVSHVSKQQKSKLSLKKRDSGTSSSPSFANKSMSYDVFQPDLHSTRVEEYLSRNVDEAFIEPSETGKQEENLEATEWVQQVDKYGNKFYLNQRTGMTSVVSPKEINKVTIAQRINFIPKGFSPIFVENKKENLFMSPTSKNELYRALIRNYKNELEVVKWTNYINNSSDAKQFFEELYKEKTKQYQDCVPNASLTSLPKFMLKLFNNVHARSYSKEVFHDLVVIGQWDKKFIVTFYEPKQLVIVFDQHAVSERICLEKLLKEYKEGDRFKATKSNLTIIDAVTEEGLKNMIDFENVFQNLGFRYSIHKNVISIYKIPICMSKFQDNRTDYVKDLIISLIDEQLCIINATRGVGTKMSQILQNIINTEACRGAIKFGDELSADECTKQIALLSDCRLPFQCAHGRPSVTPLISLDRCFVFEVFYI